MQRPGSAQRKARQRSIAPLKLHRAAGGARQGYGEGPEGQQLRIVERTIDLGEEGRYLVAVAGDAAEIDEETRSFDGALLITFGVLAIVLLLITTFQVRFGLAPLKRISEGLAAIRSGAAMRTRPVGGSTLKCRCLMSLRTSSTDTPPNSMRLTLNTPAVA